MESAHNSVHKMEPSDYYDKNFTIMAQLHFHNQAHGLRELVHNTVAGSPFVVSRNLNVEVEQSEVTLRGCVPSFHQKQLAQESIKHIEGIGEIRNELTVVQVPRLQSAFA